MMLGRRRSRQKQRDNRLAEIGAALDRLTADVGELREELGELGSGRVADTHEVRLAAARADAAVNRAADVDGRLAGRVERLAAELAAARETVAALERELQERARRDARLEEAVVTQGRRLGALEGILGDVLPERTSAQLAQGALDLPATLTTAPHVIRGWAMCEPSLARVELRIDGTNVDIRSGLPRLDVQRAHDAADAPVSGFEAWLDLSDFPGDELTIEAEGMALDGFRFSIGQAQIPVRREPFATEADEARAAELRDRFDALAPKPDEQAGDELRLVVFAHSLDYGGAELRTLGLLEHLASQPDFSCVVVSPRDGPLEHDLERLGIAVHITHGFGVGSVGRYEGKQQELAAWLRPQKPNVALGVTLASFAGVDVAGRLGIPCIWSVHETLPLRLFLAHGFPFEAPVHPYAVTRAEAAFSAAEAILFEAGASRVLYRELGDDSRSVVVPPGIDLAAIENDRTRLERPQVRQRLGIPSDAVVLLCVGILQPRKAQTVLAQAFREVSRRHPETVCVFVGNRGGAYADALDTYLARAGLCDRVRVVMAQSGVSEWFVAADYFVMPSFEETLPGAILEAMAFEIPVVATAVGGVSELIEDGVTGYLCSPGDVRELVDALEHALAGTPEQLRQLTERAASLVRERHDVRQRNEQVGSLLGRLARDPAALRATIDSGGTPSLK